MSRDYQIGAEAENHIHKIIDFKPISGRIIEKIENFGPDVFINLNKEEPEAWNDALPTFDWQKYSKPNKNENGEMI